MGFCYAEESICAIVPHLISEKGGVWHIFQPNANNKRLTVEGSKKTRFAVVPKMKTKPISEGQKQALLAALETDRTKEEDKACRYRTNDTNHISYALLYNDNDKFVPALQQRGVTCLYLGKRTAMHNLAKWVPTSWCRVGWYKVAPSTSTIFRHGKGNSYRQIVTCTKLLLASGC